MTRINCGIYVHCNKITCYPVQQFESHLSFKSDYSVYMIINVFCFFTVVPGAATIIIMVCVGFLVVMVILGVFRIRSIHRRGEGARSGAKEGSSQWDDSALTIIVNPMEVKTRSIMINNMNLITQGLFLFIHSFTHWSLQSYESRLGISADTEGEGEEDEEVAESPDDASDDQRIIIKKEGRDGNARRY